VFKGANIMGVKKYFSFAKVKLLKLLKSIISSLKTLASLKPSLDSRQSTSAEFLNPDPNKKFTKAWFENLYRELGDGVTCYRPLNEPNYGGGMLKGCYCCKPNTQLHLLPNEERMFEDVINDLDFRAIAHPKLTGGKTIVCSKLGLCNGRKPFVCRTAPVYFVSGLMMFEESLCRLLALDYLSIHKDKIANIRNVIYKLGLENTVLGYGRTVRTENGEIHYDYEH
jgi:hypothetical protein